VSQDSWKKGWEKEEVRRRNRCPPNGSDVKLRGQGPSAEAAAARGHACMWVARCRPRDAVQIL